MKRITFAIISLIAFSTISCFAEKIKGNGNIITKEIQVSDYKQIKVGQGNRNRRKLFLRQEPVSPSELHTEGR
ncbi:MAG: hypothetical protein ACLVEJ_22260 [Parabacteroides sp.]